MGNEFKAAEKEAKQLAIEIADKASHADVEQVKTDLLAALDTKFAEQNRVAATTGTTPSKADVAKEIKALMGNSDLRTTIEEDKAYAAYLSKGMNQMTQAEVKSLGSYAVSDGGILVPPEVRAQIIYRLLNVVNVRNLATIITTNPGVDVSFPTLGFSVTDSWKQEGETVAVDTLSAPFGKKSLHTHKHQNIFKVPNQLINSSIVNVESTVVDWYVKNIALIEENKYFNGNGQGVPTGLLSKDAAGNLILPSVNAATSASVPLSIADVLSLPYQIKAQYRNKGVGKPAFMVPRGGVSYLRSLLATTGQPIWSDMLTAVSGQPPMLAGYPVYETEYILTALGTVTLNNYASSVTGDPLMIFGDFSYYWIADSTQLEVFRLNELYAATDEVGYRITKWTDGAPVVAEAFSVLLRKTA